MHDRAEVDNRDKPCWTVVYEAGLAKVLPGLQPKQNPSGEQSLR